MNDFVTLLGAEQVQRAGYSMKEAAETMRQASLQINADMERQRQFLDDWLARFVAALETPVAEEGK